MSKNKKSEEFNFKELMKTPKGRAVLFFGAYLLFFVAIAIVARVGGASNGISINRQYETGSPIQFSLAGIESNNFNYNYEVIVDNTPHVYSGSRTMTNARFTLNNIVEYYFNGNVYFVNSNGLWINTENPYNFKEFMDAKMISSLIQSASYVSKTEYESGKDVYTFSISSASISKLVDNTDLDIEEVPNEIMISTDEDNYVNEVKFTLDSYCKAKSICTSNMTITLKYEEFGKIEEITSPLV